MYNFNHKVFFFGLLFFYFSVSLISSENKCQFNLFLLIAK